MRYISRRDFLTLGSVMLGGLLPGKRIRAETLNWQFNQCENKFVQGAYPVPERIAAVIKQVFGSAEVAASPRLIVNSPCTVESVGNVPIQISSDLDDIKRIALFAGHNANPLIAVLHLTPRSHLPIRLHVQLEYKAARIYAVCESGKQLYASSNFTKAPVTCSGDGG